jgi:hypothetical protein
MMQLPGFESPRETSKVSEETQGKPRETRKPKPETGFPWTYGTMPLLASVAPQLHPPLRL